MQTDETLLSNTPELSVSSIVRNEDGGYDVTYLIDDALNTITFRPSECDENERSCYEDLNADDKGGHLWPMHGTVGGILGPSNDADYHHANHLVVSGTTSDDVNFRHRQIFVFGVTTPEADQPEQGMASYDGWFFGYAYPKDGTSNRERQRIRGAFRLVANFDLSEPAINGEITNIRGQAPGQPSSTRTPWPNSRFEIIGTGRNEEGQFTATVRGMDDSDAEDIASLRGFMGQLTAQLFGPNADEIGGVVSADRDGTDHDVSLYGYISGTQFAPKMIGSAGTLVGVSRNYNDPPMTDPKDKGTATVTRTESGWTVSINDRSWNLDDSELNNETYQHAVDTDDDAAYLWSTTNGFQSKSEFEYFDVKGWADNSLGDGVWSTYYIIHGDRTGNPALPSSTASYQGRMEARVFPRDDAVNFSNAERYRGDLTLTANFANASVIGNVTNLGNRPANGSGYTDISGSAMFDAEIDGHNFTANDFSGTGAISSLQNGNVYGSFFGSTAQEAGGVFDAQTESDLIIGYFGAKQR
ncbi:MAG: transferrin-binding protein-like solute binding protein [Gammaproteobacteria bacterium]|nr:transferrin-binding protein-like solute binding protein [Gammaproteobacteria bacterium]